MSAQLWVSDVFKVFKSQEDIDKKLVKFKNISVLGTIVNVEMSPNLYEGSNDKRPVVYQVDDGTGVIRVVYFIHDKVARQRKTIDLDQCQGPLRDGVANQCLINGPLKAGATVHVKGVPHIDDQRRRTTVVLEDDCETTSNTTIKAYAVRLLVDPNDEIERMFLVDKLRKSELYSHLFSA